MMKWLILWVLIVTTACQNKNADPLHPPILMFDELQKDMWRSTTPHWTWEGDILVGKSTEENPLDENSFFIWDADVEDFILKASFRISGNGNSGIYYRCEAGPEGYDALLGYQADIDGQNNYTGIVYENFVDRHRKFLAGRGQFARISERDSVEIFSISSVNSPDHYIAGDGAWNTYELIVKGPLIVQKLNGRVVSMVEDHATNRIKKGLLGFQLHQGPPMKVEFKDVLYTDLKP